MKNVKYDGYRLTYGGLDYLALHAHTKSGAILHLGSNRTATGKESDIYLVTTPSISTSSAAASNPNLPPQRDQAVFKIHRLGRTSFRTLKTNRAYHGNRAHCTWQHLSQLSARKEHAAMRALYAAGFPVPRPVAWNRHTVVMSLVPGLPLAKVPLSAFGKVGSPESEEALAALYGRLMELTLKLAESGVIHGDFNEFNLLVENVPEPEEDDLEEDDDNQRDDIPSSRDVHDTAAETPAKAPSAKVPSPNDPARTPTLPPMLPHLIDFPQITSFSHPQASFYFDRDVECIKRFFRKRYHFEADSSGPTFQDAVSRLEAADRARAEGKGVPRLDIVMEAAGFSKKLAKELEGYFESVGRLGEEGEAEGERQGNGDAVGEDDGDTDEYDEEVRDEYDARDGDEKPPTPELTEHDEPFDLMASIRDASGYGEMSGNQDSLAPKLAALELATADQQTRAQPKSKKAAGWSI